MFKCDNCHLEFDNKATLLRHVSHKKVCKSFYGKQRLEDLRTNNKLESKKKWWKKNSSEAKEKYQLNKAKIKERKKQKHIRSEQKSSTDEGKSFTKFYEFLYNERKHFALEELEESGFAYEKFRQKEAEETAIDLVFTSQSNSFTKFFHTNAPYLMAEFEEDYPVEQETEKAMNDAYQFLLDKEIKRKMGNWMNNVNLKISQKCRDQGETSAFNNFFTEFCSTLFPKIQDEAFNLTFDNFEKDCEEIDICEEEIEQYLEDTYYKNLQTLSEKETIESEIGYKISQKLDTSIYKQIRYMKAFEGSTTIIQYGGKVTEKIVYLRNP